MSSTGVGSTAHAEDEDLLRAAVTASRRAGDYLRARASGAIQVRSKVSSRRDAPADVVTDCDLGAEEVIRRSLTEAFPGSQVLGEEGGLMGEGDADICWLVDPIDGTYNFVRRLPLYCVSIGFSVAGVPRGGCVYDPSRQELFAAAGAGLLLNGARCRPANRSGGGPPLVVTDLPHDDSQPAQREVVAVLGRAEVRRIGSSALALAWVAAGRADVAANADVYAWDVAAGRCLVAAAGGRFTAAPDPVPADRQGGFVAWTNGGAAIGPRLAKAVAAIPAQ